MANNEADRKGAERPIDRGRRMKRREKRKGNGN